MTTPKVKQSGTDNQLALNDIVNIDKVILSLENIGNKPTKIARVISQLAKEIVVEIPDDYSAVNFYKIVDKINYNNVIKYRPIINRYGFFGGLVEGICDKLDIDNPNYKSRVFEYITYLYISEKAQICGTSSQEECLVLIQKNADDILAQINTKLFELIKDSKDLEGVDVEDMQISLAVLIAVAFINCKILEKPQANNL